MASTATYGGLGPGTTRPLSPTARKKRREREAADVPLAWALRDQIAHDPAHGIPARPNPRLLLTASGTPEMTASMAGYLFGPQPRALLMALRRLHRTDATAYGYLLEYYVNKQSEREIATTHTVSRWQVASSLKWGVGFLCACVETDDEHARLRGLSADQLYQEADIEPDFDPSIDAVLGPDFDPSTDADAGPGLSPVPTSAPESPSLSASLTAVVAPAVKLALDGLAS